MSFNELYVKLYTRRSKFFKRLNTFPHLERMKKEIRKIYQKYQDIKG
ncbi:MAG: hypothetical protein ACMUEL_08450 [Flavobacteriales bacterium Tduv]